MLSWDICFSKSNRDFCACNDIYKYLPENDPFIRKFILCQSFSARPLEIINVFVWSKTNISDLAEYMNIKSVNIILTYSSIVAMH